LPAVAFAGGRFCYFPAAMPAPTQVPAEVVGPLLRPETAVFGYRAPCAPIQNRHRETIYYVKR
jgi:hypothetical protein